MNEKPLAVSPLILNRLSLYLRCLRELKQQGITSVSSKELAERFQLSAALIRKDLAQFGEFGIRGIGYKVDHLYLTLRGVLGLDREQRLAVVGVGHLGSALARYLDLNRGAFRLVAAFDSDRRKVGRKIGDVEIHHISELEGVVRTAQVRIALLTVPPEAAQEVCDALTAAGVRAVLNFAPVQLQVDPRVPTKSVDVRIHLEELAFFLQS